MITIFTDGACDFNKKGRDNNGAFSYVMVNENGVKMSEFVSKEKNTTNNRMEMKAVISSLEKVQHIIDEEIIINSDSRYIVDCVNDRWYVKWIKNGWVRQGEPVANRDLWEKLISLLNPNIKFKWIKGHNNNTWNEYCDELCRKELYGGSSYVTVIQGLY